MHYSQIDMKDLIEQTRTLAKPKGMRTRDIKRQAVKINYRGKLELYMKEKEKLCSWLSVYDPGDYVDEYTEWERQHRSNVREAESMVIHGTSHRS